MLTDSDREHRPIIEHTQTVQACMYHELEQAEKALIGLSQLNEVLDGVADNTSAAHHHLDGVPEVFFGERLHLLWERG